VPFPTTSSPLARALAERNYDQPTPVQLAVLADDAVGRDLLVSAQTGSGKTVAYGLAMAKDLLGDAERFEPAAAPLALIVAPTRELALQVQRELAWLYEHADGRVVSCVGGMDPRREQRELADGAHIVVGTPGRLCDHLRRGRLDISGLRVVVLDEADEMLNLGFREDMEFILETTPESRRTLLFSATFPRGIVSPNNISSRRSASRSPATKAAMPTSSTGPSGSPPTTSSTRSSISSVSMRRRARWCSATPAKPSGICRRRCWSVASRWPRCPAK